MWPDAASQALASKLCRLKTQTGDSVLAAGALSTIARPESVAEMLVEALVMTCNPNLSRSDRNINEFINTSRFSPASKGSVGMDSGYDNITGPAINQWDMSLYKNVSIREKARIQLRLEAFNAFNHTEWGGVNSTILFDSAGTVKNLPSQLGGGGGRLGFGALNAIRANSQRILQIAAKVVF